MQKIIILIIALITLTACSPRLDDLVEFTEAVKQRVPKTIEPYREFVPQPAFAYAASNQRSPFDPTMQAALPIQVQAPSNCLQPDFARAKQPLEQFGIDALALTGHFTTNNVRWVLIKTNDGGLHKATQGSRLGLFFGKIILISDTSVVIEELLPDGAGCWQRQETVLSLESPVGENNNV